MGRERGRLGADGKETKEKWRTSGQMRIGMDLGTDERRVKGLEGVR